MSDTCSVQEDENVAGAPLVLFRYQKLEPQTLVNCTPETIEPSGRQAIQFYGDGAAAQTTMIVEESDSDEESASPSTAGGAHDSRCSGLDTESKDAIKRETHRSDADFIENHIESLKRFAPMQEELRKVPALASRLNLYESMLAAVTTELAAVRKRLHLMHNQSIHLSQELFDVERGKSRCHMSGQSATYPFLVHPSSIPLLKARIEFERRLHDLPKVIVGVQIQDPSAMVLAFVSDVDFEGFTLHVDLANHADFANRTDLLRGVVTWMAFIKK